MLLTRLHYRHKPNPAETKDVARRVVDPSLMSTHDMPVLPGCACVYTHACMRRDEMPQRQEKMVELVLDRLVRHMEREALTALELFREWHGNSDGDLSTDELRSGGTHSRTHEQAVRKICVLISTACHVATAPCFATGKKTQCCAAPQCNATLCSAAP